jgi:hypothetical protein
MELNVTRRMFRASLFLALVTAAIAGEFVASADSDRYLWKSVPTAQCKLDEKVPLTFNVFLPDKKKEQNFVLVLLGRRYLALDIKARRAYSVVPSDLTAKGADFESGNLFTDSKILPTDNWFVRDVGPAELVRLTLKDYGRVLQIELPHMQDFRAVY